MESDASPKTLKPAHVVIVGAGPSGLLLAFYLLEFGGGRFRVSIFESREDLRVTAKRELNARRYSLVLSVSKWGEEPPEQLSTFSFFP
jgi:cation diffusion facilitator CzcD-associated flavoprotein CzcO